MKIGYARVSTQEQELSLQLDALKEAGCDKVYQEKFSGSQKERPQLNELLDFLREHDTIVVWRLDRLGRSLRDLLGLVAQIQKKGASLVSLNDAIDTTTPQGTLVFHIFAALAEFERQLIRERTKAGLQSARARGRHGGRPRGLSQDAENKAAAVEALYKENKLSTTEICNKLNISRGTLYKYLRHRNVKISSYQKRIN